MEQNKRYIKLSEERKKQMGAEETSKKMGRR
jgi:hypothetical protein